MHIPTLVQQTPATAHRAWQPVRVLILPVFRLLQAPKRPPLSVTAKKPIGNGIITAQDSNLAWFRSSRYGEKAAKAVISILKQK